MKLHQRRLVIFFASVVLSALSFLPIAVFAQTGFGGKIQQIFYQCHQGKYLTVGQPKGGNFIFSHGSRAYDYGAPNYAGQWILGVAAGGMACTYQCGPYTCVYGVGQLILFAGTSR